ncbi:gamma-glutamylcyclotransferase family protein [Pollutimonas bauzanensis]|uniref:Gamma-glutamyl cyclotransferase, AIG2-like n=1 Tax=Pollutimonas bauzanensis TaxID=658167 RepID=A0A1M5VZ77_9BURK|nr:gamma-glutamylcyclotransferase family protein [Pollutimonas bauzanensis]SHH80517.1 Gamma-glutamyl cyclotransferase, AIG2-like [Pollutimonas bauzanensis]
MSDTTVEPTEYLFSYGTLQLEAVQQATFGRKLDGHADQLPGYRLGLLEIRDPAVVATSGKAHHPIVAYTGDARDCVEGMVLRITSAELRQADGYEVSDYRRDRVVLASGTAAWAYVDARAA